MEAIDYAVLGTYFVGILLVGLWFGRAERNTKDYFLGGRRQHWLLAGISIVATEVSALTYVNVPAVAFREDWAYLQMYFGSFVGRVLIVFLLLPAFYGGSVTTVYEYLGQRFGPGTRTTAAIMFFLSRVLGSGFRLLAGSLALSVVFDWPLWLVVIGSAAVTTAYATVGGIRAILWTDLFQALIFIGGAAVVVGFILTFTPGSPTDLFNAAHQAEKFHVFRWSGGFNDDKAFWVLFIHAMVQTMAALGCDQDLTQRMLTCRNLREGQKSLLFNAFVGFPIVCLFLTIGVLLFLFYQSLPADSLPELAVQNSDRVFPCFIAEVLPAGLRGLLVTAIFAATMSSLASSIGALSSSAVTDFYRPMRTLFSRNLANPDDIHYLRVARWFSFGFGALLITVAMAFAARQELLWEAFQWGSLFFGGMLGVFLLGVTTQKRGADSFNPIIMIASVILLITLKYVQESRGVVYIAWPWWVVLGTVWTFVLCACFGSRRIRPIPEGVSE